MGLPPTNAGENVPGSPERNPGRARKQAVPAWSLL
jgi:hypothetical protein